VWRGASSGRHGICVSKKRRARLDPLSRGQTNACAQSAPTLAKLPEIDAEFDRVSLERDIFTRLIRAGEKAGDSRSPPVSVVRQERDNKDFCRGGIK
jgi:hypothetical protein